MAAPTSVGVVSSETVASHELFCNCAMHNSFAPAGNPAEEERAENGAGERRRDDGAARRPPGSSGLMRAIRLRAESNKLYRQNLAKGRTGLSIAFDLPTQTGYDSDHPLARGEVGKAGVAISTSATCGPCSRDPLASMNTSMTINATAPWLMALYLAVADEQGASVASFKERRRTTSSRNIWPAGPTSFRARVRRSG